MEPRPSASFNLPNLVTVGAVDIAGRKTSFTTEGKSVDFYAGGHLIEGYAPQGRRLILSGNPKRTLALLER